MILCVFYSPFNLGILNDNYLCIILLSSVIILLSRYNIDTHDYDVRLRAAKKFLKDGDKVGICFVILCIFCVFISDFHLTNEHF